MHFDKFALERVPQPELVKLFVINHKKIVHIGESIRGNEAVLDSMTTAKGESLTIEGVEIRKRHLANDAKSLGKYTTRAELLLAVIESKSL
jgi:hypothetical protein